MANRWKKKHSQQIREMLAGEHESQTKLNVGYTKGKTTNEWDDKKPGDKWVDDKGNDWEITEKGAVIKHGKLDELRKSMQVYHNCPKEKCVKNQWNENHVDKRTKRIHGMCMDCVVEQDTKKMIDGTWKEYAAEVHKANRLAELREMEEEAQRLKRMFETDSYQYVNKEGDVEKWQHGVTPESIDKKFNEFKINFLKDRNLTEEDFEEYKKHHQDVINESKIDKEEGTD